MIQNIPMNAPIGVFDSGVGGLSVLKAIYRTLPNENTLYLADQGHVPYGPRPLQEVRTFAEGITRFLLTRGVKLIVVACNAASAAALHYLRDTFPMTPIVGMEPAVKPAVEHTHTGVVGVLATSATFQGALYASVVERFASGVILLQHTCPGLVAQIEEGNLDTPETRVILEQALLPMMDQKIDTVVLGCTHYPFVIPLIQEIVGPTVRVIDPAPAVARQVGRILEAQSLQNKEDLVGSNIPTRSMEYFTTGDPFQLSTLFPRLLGIEGQVQRLTWVGDFLS